MLEEELVDIKLEEHFDSSSNKDPAENACSDMNIKVEDFDDNVELYDAIVIKEEGLEDSVTDISRPEATAQEQVVKDNAAASNQIPIDYLLTRRQLFDVLREKAGEKRVCQKAHLYNCLLKHFKLQDETAISRLKTKNTLFCSKLYSKLDACRSIANRFLEKHVDWLSQPFEFEIEDDPQPGTSYSGCGTRGRPKVPFTDSSSMSKRRKVESLTKSFVAEEISSVQMSRKFKRPVPFTPDEALSIMIEARDTKHQYMVHRLAAKQNNADIYPSYQKIRDAKSRCYPLEEAKIVTETSAEIRLQALLDHTATRIVEMQKEVILSLPSANNLVLSIKWGCDGSTGHSQYKQLFSESGLGDGDIFLTALVPLQLYVDNPEGKKIIWQNQRPSSTRLCRPITFQFKKESTELIQNEVDYVDGQIGQLIPTKCQVDNQEVSISYVCVLMKINEKMKSEQACYICKATPNEMNKIDMVLRKPIDKNAVKFGLSSLHAWIRFFECLLHISYRLDLKTLQICGIQNQSILKARKEQIQKEFREKAGLLVDIPKSDGSGTTNDGNTARRFFNNTALSASITGIDESLIQRFGVILRTLSCGFAVNLEAFRDYAIETARLYVAKYNWYFMPVSVHEILIHGPIIIEEAILPIGQLSEDAQESRNKDLKKFRELHNGKISRIAGNQNLLNRLLVTSDPLISSLTQLPSKKSSSIPSEVLCLLKKPEAPQEPNTFTDTESDTSSFDGQSDDDDFASFV